MRQLEANTLEIDVSEQYYVQFLAIFAIENSIGITLSSQLLKYYLEYL